MKQRRGRFLWVTPHEGKKTIVWFNLGGHKPLAHLPWWKRRCFHLPSIRWRLWPRPFHRYAYSPREMIERHTAEVEREREWMRDTLEAQRKEIDAALWRLAERF